MIDKNSLIDVINKAIAGTDMFLVDVEIAKNNAITVEVDSMTSVSIDECVKITRAVEAEFDRDVEDYELEVGSAGLTSPFKVKAQYEKNLGNEVEVLTAGGIKTKGVLSNVGDNDFTIKVSKKVKPEGSKRPVLEIGRAHV